MIARALRPPPIVRFLSWVGPLAAAGCRAAILSNRSSATGTGKCGALRNESAVGLVPSPAAPERREGSFERRRNDAAQVAGLSRIGFCGLSFYLLPPYSSLLFRGFVPTPRDHYIQGTKPLLTTCFRRTSTGYRGGSQLLHNSFVSSLCLRLC